MILVSCLSISLIAACSALWLSVQKNLEFSDKIDDIQESIQTAIDVLNERYSVMDAKTKIEVFSDEPIIRDLIRDIKISKNSILVVAKLLDETVQTEMIDDEQKAEEK